MLWKIGKINPDSNFDVFLSLHTTPQSQYDSGKYQEQVEKRSIILRLFFFHSYFSDIYLNFPLNLDVNVSQWKCAFR